MMLLMFPKLMKLGARTATIATSSASAMSAGIGCPFVARRTRAQREVGVTVNPSLECVM
jgi:hypothetical protein